jgi:hypothetical protein
LDEARKQMNEGPGLACNCDPCAENELIVIKVGGQAMRTMRDNLNQPFGSIALTAGAAYQFAVLVALAAILA